MEIACSASCAQGGDEMAKQISPRWLAMKAEHHRRFCRAHVDVIHLEPGNLVESRRIGESLTDRISHNNVPFGVARLLDAIGDGWSLLIVRGAFDGLRQFGEFRKNLGIAKNIPLQKPELRAQDGRLLQAQDTFVRAPASTPKRRRERAPDH